MKSKKVPVLVALTLALGSGTAWADSHGHDNETGDGHEKCIGDGHDRDAACRGRVGNTEAIIGDQTYCDKQFAQAVESSWRRYACDLSTESTAYGDVVLVYGETTEASILDYADRATGLLKIPPAPQPEVVPDPDGELSRYVESTTTGIFDYATGATGLLKIPPAPQPEVIPDPTRLLEGTVVEAGF